MSTINERLQSLLDALNISKTDFAKKIHVSPAFVSMICSGKSSPSERTIKDICREYGVDEIWLRDGIGEMFRPRTREDEIVEFCADLLGPDATEDQKKFVANLGKLTPEQWSFLYDIIKTLSGDEK